MKPWPACDGPAAMPQCQDAVGRCDSRELNGTAPQGCQGAPHQQEGCQHTLPGSRPPSPESLSDS